MKIETFDRDDHQKKVVAEFDNDTIERFKRQAARKIGAQTRIPGFRPGKAPYDMIQRTVGDQAILDEALNLLIDENYPKIIAETGVQPYGPGKLDEIITLDPPRFSFLIPLTPEVELGEYKSIRKEHNPPTISDEQVDLVVERLRRRAGTAVEVERPAEAGDLLLVKLSATLVEPDEGQDAELIKEHSNEMVAGTSDEHTDADGNEWPYPGFVDNLVGMSKGESKTTLYTFPETDNDDDLNGKTAEFHFTIENVKEIQKPELTDEWAATQGPHKSVHDLREYVYQQLLDSETQNYNRDYIDDVIAEVVACAAVKYPPVLVDDEVEHTLHHFAEDLGRNKIDLDTYLKIRDVTREDFIKNEVRPSAEERIKRQLVMQEFALKEQIEIKPDEAQMIYAIAENQAKSDKGLKAAQGKLTTRQLADRVANSTLNEILNQRLINRLKDIATGVADKPVESGAEEAAVEEAAPAKKARKVKKAEAESAAEAAADTDAAPAKKPRASKKAAAEAVAVEEAPAAETDAASAKKPRKSNKKAEPAE